MQLTVFTDYGFRTLMFLAGHPDRLCSVKEISEVYGISRNHLVKVVHRLGLLGYVVTAKGKGGGIRLADTTRDLRLGDLVNALEPNMDLVECFNAEANTCRITSSCQLKHYLFAARQVFIAELNRHTLKDIVDKKPFFGAAFLPPDRLP